MTILTTDTYEATWYLMMGGKLTDIAFGKISENKRTKSGYIQKYTLTIEEIDYVFVKRWRNHNAIDNVRKFATMRQGLKRKIYKEKLKRRL